MIQQKINLVIADNDSSYVKSLVEYIDKEHSSVFTTKAFYEVTAMQDFINNLGEYYNESSTPIITACNSYFYDFILKTEYKGFIALLSDKKDTNSSHINIYKYQNAEAICSLLLESVEMRNKTILPEKISEQEKEKTPKIITLFSPDATEHKTYLAYSLCRLLAVNETKVLYLNLESISPVNRLFEGYKAGTSITNALLMLQQGKTLSQSEIESLRNVDTASGIHFWGAPVNTVDIGDITNEDYALIVRSIYESGLYDYIILDMPSCLSRQILYAISQSNLLLMAIETSKLALHKLAITIETLSKFIKSESFLLSEQAGKKSGIALSNCQKMLIVNKKSIDAVIEPSHTKFFNHIEFINDAVAQHGTIENHDYSQLLISIMKKWQKKGSWDCQAQKRNFH